MDLPARLGRFSEELALALVENHNQSGQLFESSNRSNGDARLLRRIDEVWSDRQCDYRPP